MTKTKKRNLVGLFSAVENFLEYLGDEGFLSESGKKARHDLWVMGVCDAFSCVVFRDGWTAWRLGEDSHSTLLKEARVADDKLNPAFAFVEIVPKKDYLHPQAGWKFEFDDGHACPEWWKQSHEKAAWAAHKKWCGQLYRVMSVKKLLALKSPLVGEPKTPTVTDFLLLEEWASVGGSVGASVWDSVGASVRASVGDSVGASAWDSVRASAWGSVGASVWDSVGDSVGDSVWANFGACFYLPRSAWKNTDRIKGRGYPFQPAVALWKRGFVPVFDGQKWLLLSGKKAVVVHEWVPNKKEAKTK